MSDLLTRRRFVGDGYKDREAIAKEIMAGGFDPFRFTSSMVATEAMVVVVLAAVVQKIPRWGGCSREESLRRSQEELYQVVSEIVSCWSAEFGDPFEVEG